MDRGQLDSKIAADFLYDVLSKKPELQLKPIRSRDRTKAQLFLIGSEAKELYVIVGDHDKHAKSTRILIEHPLNAELSGVRPDSVVGPYNGSSVKNAAVGRRISIRRQHTVYVDSIQALERLIGWYAAPGLGNAVLSFTTDESNGPGSSTASTTESVSAVSSKRMRPPMSLEDFQTQLDRRSKIGEAGEKIAIEDEERRLKEEAGCFDPKRYVEHVALTDVGRGYDIKSTWPGHERCIEVKSSTSSGNDIFMSDNERVVLQELGTKAWLYRVVIDANGDKKEVLRLNDPMSQIPEENFSTSVWRVRLPDVDE